MLASLLALVIGLGSLALYAAAFLFPTLHRKSDFIWSGVGLFYALVLWVCAGQVRGGLLLGETASVALLGWLSWEMLKLRWEVLSPRERPPLPDTTSVAGWVKSSLELIQGKATGLTNPGAKAQQPRSQTVTPAKATGPKSSRLPERPRTTPTAPVVSDLPDDVPEYELVEPEPMRVPVPEVQAIATPPDATPSPVVPEPEPEATPPVVPVPSVQPSTLKGRQATPTSSSLETAREVWASLQAGGQQLWRNLSGRKPKRTMIVLDRTKSSTTPTETPAPSENSLDDDFDFDFEEAILNNETELAPEAAAAVIPEEVEVPEVVVVETTIDVVEETEAADPDLATAATVTDGFADVDLTTREVEEPSETEEVPDLVRPNPPDPTLVAEAVADAAEKDLPADPPDPAPIETLDSDEIPPT